MASDRAQNFTLPGNPRYQPKNLQDYFGYDNIFRYVAEVEIANLRTLADIDIGVISKEAIQQLTPEMEKMLLEISTTEVDKVEREVTHHDIRAWVQIAQDILPADLRRWVHVPLTSYDALDTARSLQFVRAHKEVVLPAINQIVKIFVERIREYSEIVQIGRTHGQHAIPITVGFWMSTILSRILYNAEKMNEFAGQLPGKISGAVGAYNAQVGVSVSKKVPLVGFESRVLRKLGLKPARISTQILPPEPLDYYLFSAVMLSGALGQFGRDCRHLMRSEIGEICEPFGSKQVGSSTMAHKRNPINFENLEGMYLRSKNEFGKVLDTLISEHQRDLVGSCVARDYPIIIVNLVQQLNTLLREDKITGKSFLERISIDKTALQRNFDLEANVVMAEAAYIALQMAGYPKDAHHCVNHVVVPYAKENKVPLVKALWEVSAKDPDLCDAMMLIPKETLELLANPRCYIGEAIRKAMEICGKAENFMSGC